VIDTALPAPDDIVDTGTAPPVGGGSYTVAARSLVLVTAPVRSAPEPGLNPA
jgi:hypothetical protein